MPMNPLLHALTLAVFAIHIAAGTIGLFSGTVAISAAKGERLHRTAGTVFFISMLVMAASAAYLGVVMPGQLINVFIAAFATYLIVTAWLAVKRGEGTVGTQEKIALAVAICLCAPFLILSFQVAAGLPLLVKSAFAIKGPILIALYSFTSVLVIAVLGDLKVVLAGGISGAPRIARHLWRMCLGLTMAAGSAFTNGLPRLLPATVHVKPIFFFLPQFVPVVLLVYWMIRVRFTNWWKPTVITQSV